MLVAFLLNLIFAFIEVAGGLWTNSVAILSDALHDFGDSISLGVAWRLQKLSEKGRTPKYTYGYKRFSLLGAILMCVILLTGSIFVVKASIERIMNPVDKVNEMGMLVMAVIGIIVNGYAAFRLNKGSSLSERAAMLHIMEDVLGWVAVLIVSIVMHFVHAPILDSILSLVITVWILFNVYQNLRSSFRILLQGTPADFDLKGLEQKLRQIEGISSVHDLHVWSMDGEAHVLTVHLVLPIEDKCSPDNEARIKEEVRELGMSYDIRHATIEIDYAGYPCGMENC